MRYYCEWFPPIMFNSYLRTGAYWATESPDRKDNYNILEFNKRINVNFVALGFAMVEVNLKELNTGFRVLPQTKRDNPLKCLNSFLFFVIIADFFSIVRGTSKGFLHLIPP